MRSASSALRLIALVFGITGDLFVATYKSSESAALAAAIASGALFVLTGLGLKYPFVYGGCTKRASPKAAALRWVKKHP
jgi:hypothetical protein